MRPIIIAAAFCIVDINYNFFSLIVSYVSEVIQWNAKSMIVISARIMTNEGFISINTDCNIITSTSKAHPITAS